MATCEEAVDDNCCVMCDYVSYTIAILPGASVEYLWSGSIYTVDDSRCDGCGCYTTSDPFIGEYEIIVDAYTEVTCLGSLDPCAPPDVSGRFDDSVVSGESNSYLTPLDVLYDSESLTIEISL